MSNPRTQHPLFLCLFQNVYIIYVLTRTYTSNSLKYACHNCKKECAHMQQTKCANKQTLYLQKFNVLNLNEKAILVISFIMTIFSEFV